MDNKVALARLRRECETVKCLLSPEQPVSNYFQNICTKFLFSFRLQLFGWITSCSENLCRFRFPTFFCKICSLPLWSNSSKPLTYFWQSTKLNRKISMRSSLLVIHIIQNCIAWCMLILSTGGSTRYNGLRNEISLLFMNKPVRDELGIWIFYLLVYFECHLIFTEGWIFVHIYFRPNWSCRNRSIIEGFILCELCQAPAGPHYFFLQILVIYGQKI